MKPQKLSTLTGVLLLAATVSSNGQTTNTVSPYDALYCFGFSWTDTQGLSPDGSPSRPNGNPQYWQNRYSNGPMWPEFLSTNLGLLYIKANNLARAGATTGNTLAQVESLPSRNEPERGLYIVWVAASDFLYAADSRYGAAIDWTDET